MPAPNGKRGGRGSGSSRQSICTGRLHRSNLDSKGAVATPACRIKLRIVKSLSLSIEMQGRVVHVEYK